MAKASPKTKAKPAKIPSKPRVSAKSVRLALIEYGGNVSAVADAFQVARQTVYNWIRDYKLRDLMKESRDAMFSIAQDNIYLAVQAGDQEASRFVLTHMPLEGRWTSKSEIKTEFDLPKEVLEILKAAGVDVKKAMTELAMIAKERPDLIG